MRIKKFKFAIVVWVAVLSLGLFAQNSRSKRLYLKDGSYQSAREWKVVGNRVRYFSAERYAWEELPKSLVDWSATEKYGRERATIDAAERAQKTAEEEADRKVDEALSPTVAPGVRLPESGGVFLLEPEGGVNHLVELHPSGGNINKQTGKNIFRAIVNPIAVANQTIELKGERSQVQTRMPQPTLYVRLESNDNNDDEAKGGTKTGASNATAPAPPPVAQAKAKLAGPAAKGKANQGAGFNWNERFRIVRLKSKPGSRILGNLKISMTGKLSEHEEIVPTLAEPFVGGWEKVRPAAPLSPGEYALVEMLGEKQMNLYVYDFGVDPHAAAPGGWKSVTAKPTAPAEPQLGKRKNN